MSSRQRVLQVPKVVIMGILYTVWPLDSAARHWLQSQAIPLPATPSRWPTRTEIREVLGDLTGIEVKYTENGPRRQWDAFLSDGDGDGNWTLLHAEPQSNNDDVTRVHFENGEPTLIVAILRALAATTGPFVLLPDTGCPPMVVSTSRSVPEIVADYCTIDTISKKWQTLLSCAPGARPLDEE